MMQGAFFLPWLEHVAHTAGADADNISTKSAVSSSSANRST
jgi:hypothetical protein